MAAREFAIRPGSGDHDGDPELVILGHELIHTWRMVAGMRIFLGGWEEEAMTTGPLPDGQQFECGKGIWPEHIKAWEDWQKANPDRAKKKINITKKSGFSSPIRNIFGR